MNVKATLHWIQPIKSKGENIWNSIETLERVQD